MKDRIEWIDGLKGIACLLILTHHYLVGFLPAIYYGRFVQSHFKYDVFLSQSVLSFPIVGNFWVFVFCLLSGFIITILSSTKNNIYNTFCKIVKRYIHFAIPLLFISILVYIFNKYNLFTNVRIANITGSPWLRSFYTQKISLFNYIKIALIDTLFYGSDKISTAFWMLKYMFLGSILTYLICLIFNKINKKYYLLLVILMICFAIKDHYCTLLSSFIMGFLLAKLYKSNFVTNHKKICIVIGIICLLLGVFLGGYPSGCIPNNYYKIFSFLEYYHLHFIASSLLLFGIILLDFIKKILSLKTFAALGAISYEIYLLHILIIFSFSTSMFELLYNKNGSYLLDIFIIYIISLIVIILLSILFKKTIIRLTIYIENKVYNLIKKEKKSGKNLLKK